MAGIAFIDLESTGLRASDRAVEIGVVLMAPDGDIEDTFTTLINPHRHIDASEIHGITASDLVRAPDFASLAPYLGNMLAGRLLVAHNAWFDLSLLAREFARIDMEFPSVTPAVCTLRMCSSMLGSIRSLAVACEFLSIDLEHHHNAVDDALASAEIFRRLVWDLGQPGYVEGAGTFYWEDHVGRLLSEPGHLEPFLGQAERAWARPLHSPAPPANCCTRQDAARHRHTADRRIAHLIDNLPVDATAPTWASVEYLDLLDAVMLDRLVTEQEAAELASLAADLGLTAEAARKTHRHYLDRLVTAALRDGVVTAEERDDLERVCRLLDLDEALLEEALQTPVASPVAAGSGLPGAVMFEPGDRVTFTGDTNPKRAVLESMAAEAGLDVGAVTKKSKALVAADPNSESGKARKARDYGVPVMGVQAFLYALEDLRGSTLSDNGVEL